MKPLKFAWMATAAMMLGTAGIIVILEAAVRLLLPQNQMMEGEFVTEVIKPAGLENPYFPDPALGYRLVPGVEYETRTSEFTARIAANANGFRGPLVRPAAVREKPLIVSTGDSFLFGHGVNEPERALDLIARQAPDLDWMNLSLPGTGTDQHLFFWRHHAKAERPALVIEWVFLNDLADNTLDFHYFPKPGFRLGTDGNLVEYPAPAATSRKVTLAGSADRLFKTRSHLYALVRNRLKLLQISRNPEANRNNSLLLAYSRTRQTPYVHNAIRLFRAILSRYAREVRESRSEFAVVVVPHLWELEMPGASYWNDWKKIAAGMGVDPADFDMTAFSREVTEWGQSENVPVFSLLPHFRRAVAEGRVPYYPADGHWTAEGNRIVSEAFINDFLPRLGPLTASRR